MHRSRAFTLIELMVVILIIAVVAAVMVPAYAGFYSKTRFDAEIRRQQDYFAEARERAIKDDTTVTVHFEHGAAAFSIAIDPLPQQSDLPTAMLTAAGTDLSLSPDVSPYHIGNDFRVENFVTSSAGSGSGGPLANSQSDVQFRGDGTSDSAEYDIKSGDGYFAHLTLSPMTGRLTLMVPLGGGR